MPPYNLREQYETLLMIRELASLFNKKREKEKERKKKKRKKSSLSPIRGNIVDLPEKWEKVLSTVLEYSELPYNEARGLVVKLRSELGDGIVLDYFSPKKIDWSLSKDEIYSQLKAHLMEISNLNLPLEEKVSEDHMEKLEEQSNDPSEILIDVDNEDRPITLRNWEEAIELLKMERGRTPDTLVRVYKIMRKLCEEKIKEAEKQRKESEEEIWY